jgi:hypothetical protein
LTFQNTPWMRNSTSHERMPDTPLYILHREMSRTVKRVLARIDRWNGTISGWNTRNDC